MTIAMWGENPILTLDTETTAANPEEALILDVFTGFIAKKPDGTYHVERWQTFVNPGVDIPEESIAIHGITNEKVQAEGISPAEMLVKLKHVLRRALGFGATLVIMNAPYDLTVLDREAKRHGVDPLKAAYEDDLCPVLDPGVLDKRFTKYRKRVSETQGARCLKTICQAYELSWDDNAAHGAEYDAMQTARVAMKMARYSAASVMSLITEKNWRKEDALNISQTRYLSPVQLHQFQVDWYKEQSDGLREYFSKSARSATDDESRQKFTEAAASVHGEWPILQRKDV